MNQDPLFIGIVVLLTVAVLLGGSSRNHAVQVSIVELAALPPLGLAILRLWDSKQWLAHRGALALLGAVVAVPAVQLVPLPPTLWTALPGRESAALALDLVGIAPGWSPASLTPELTLRSLMALAPPAAVLLGVLALSSTDRRRLPMTLVLLALVSVGLGALQILGGDPFYPWAHTNRGTVSGFFANRNHLATLCLIALPFCAALGGAAVRREKRGVALAAILVGVFMVAVALTRSRAGLGLVGPTLLASAAVAWIAAGGGRPKPALTALIAGVGAALTLVLSLGLEPILDRFDQDATEDVRFDRWPLVADTAQTYLPVGAGVGGFDRIYRSVEPVEEVDATYFNQAHNDYLETWLEGGWFSVGVLVGLLFWFARRSLAAWRAPPGEADLMRAASVAICIVLAHSAVDYPLRTLTILCVAAFCAALLEGRSLPSTERPAARRLA